jgi:crotonobetainyl-CoA:carnitine CoA-transferase CaiB-like acyl-CoA transferase
VRQTGIAIKLSDTPGRIRHTGPSVGEQTEEVLSALGYSEAQRARLYEDGVVA